jgi:formyltetrahydrofolate-dependent phosphoribosylglycinamide formyltransferase
VSLRLAIFVSGRGSNMEAIIRAIKDRALDAVPAVVLSNDANAKALELARDYGVPAVAVSNVGLNRAEHERAVLDALSAYEFDYIVLAGYMRILTPSFLSHFRDPRGFYKVINIHPSLLPAFPGKSAYEEAFNYGVKVSGITVHLVDEQVDHGAILAQEAFPRYEDDTLDSFKQRGLKVEHALYPRVLQEVSKKGINVQTRQRESVEI